MGPGRDWCGEIDAAPYMPADIFQPQNFLSLLAYAQLTIRTYVNPNDLVTPAVGESSVILLQPPLYLWQVFQYRWRGECAAK